MDLISIKNGKLKFGRFVALDEINLKILQGERIALLGHNGAGKSVLIDVLAGIKKLTKGTVEYGMKNFRDSVGIQFQAKDFPQGLKFKSLLNFYLDIYKIKHNSNRVEELLKSFKIKHLLDRNLQKMSGGQKQKVSIVIALLNKPKIIFVDEILTGLDITSQARVLKMLIDYVNKDKTLTLISASHNELEIENLVDRIIVLKQGKIVEDVSKKEVLKKHKTIVNFMSNFGGDYE